MAKHAVMQATVQHQRKSVKKPSPSSEEKAAPVYQTQKTSLKLHTALGLYKLTDNELFWELQLDTPCLISWNEHWIVVAFRGTASLKNAWLDLQVVAGLLMLLAHHRQTLPLLVVITP